MCFVSMFGFPLILFRFFFSILILLICLLCTSQALFPERPFYIFFLLICDLIFGFDANKSSQFCGSHSSPQNYLWLDCCCLRYLNRVHFNQLRSDFVPMHCKHTIHQTNTLESHWLLVQMFVLNSLLFYFSVCQHYEMHCSSL